MTKRTIFISFDGKEFATKKECCKYEMSMIYAFKKIKTICKAQSHCENCKFTDLNGDCLLQHYSPEDWDLEEIQKRLGD